MKDLLIGFMFLILVFGPAFLAFQLVEKKRL